MGERRKLAVAAAALAVLAALALPVAALADLETPTTGAGAAQQVKKDEGGAAQQPKGATGAVATQSKPLSDHVGEGLVAANIYFVASADDFGRAVRDAPHALVFFYGRGCIKHQCRPTARATMDVLAKGVQASVPRVYSGSDAASEASFLSNDNKIIALTVDCGTSRRDKLRALCNMYDTTGYPTVKMFHRRDNYDEANQILALEESNSSPDTELNLYDDNGIYKTAGYVAHTKSDTKLGAVIREYRGEFAPAPLAEWAARRAMPSLTVRTLASDDEATAFKDFDGAAAGVGVRFVATVPEPITEGGPPSWQERVFVDAVIDAVCGSSFEHAQFAMQRVNPAEAAITVTAHFSSALNDPRSGSEHTFEVEPRLSPYDDTHGHSEPALRRFFKAQAWPLVNVLTDADSHDALMEHIGGGDGLSGEDSVLLVLAADDSDIAGDAEIHALALQLTTAGELAKNASAAGRPKVVSAESNLPPSAGLRVATLSPSASIAKQVMHYCRIEAADVPAARIVDLREMRVYAPPKGKAEGSADVSVPALTEFASAFLAGELTPISDGALVFPMYSTAPRSGTTSRVVAGKARDEL